jgi:cysteine sulfinate desulfinase/cysteine desulfurase-like protein
MPRELAETGRMQPSARAHRRGPRRLPPLRASDALHPTRSWRDALDRPLPQRGVGIDAVADELLRVVIPNGSSIPRPGFSSFITTGATTASALAATAAGIAAPQRYGHTAFNFLEALSLRWLAELFGLEGMEGVYSSGGSVANLLALGAARQRAFERSGRDPAADGIDRPVAVYATTEAHHTIQRSAGVLGIGRRAVRAIPCDRRGRMRVDALAEAIAADRRAGVLPVAIVANAGTTNTGAIDPLREIGELAAASGVWFHVDGAYGLPGVLDERVAPLYDGLELADSVIVDPHKWLGAAVGVGATFVRDRELLRRAFTAGAGGVPRRQHGAPAAGPAAIPSIRWTTSACRTTTTASSSARRAAASSSGRCCARSAPPAWRRACAATTTWRAGSPPRRAPSAPRAAARADALDLLLPLRRARRRRSRRLQRAAASPPDAREPQHAEHHPRRRPARAQAVLHRRAQHDGARRGARRRRAADRRRARA